MTQLHKKWIFLGLLALLPFTGGTAHAQDLLADLAHIKEVLRDPNSFFAEMKVEIEYADGMPTQDMPRSLHTIIKIDNGNYFYENEMASMIVNQNWVVGVMHAQKQIVYGRNNSRELEKARKMALAKDIPTDPALAQKAVYLGEENGSRHYRIDNPGNGLKQTDMYIGTATGFFTRLVNEYADPAKTGVKRTSTEFLKFNDKATFSPGEFSEKLFLRFSGKTVLPAEKYKGYQLMYTDPDLLKNF